MAFDKLKIDYHRIMFAYKVGKAANYIKNNADNNENNHKAEDYLKKALKHGEKVSKLCRKLEVMIPTFELSYSNAKYLYNIVQKNNTTLRGVNELIDSLYKPTITNPNTNIQNSSRNKIFGYQYNDSPPYCSRYEGNN